MDDLISRQDLLDALDKAASCWNIAEPYHEGIRTGFRNAARIVLSLPSAQPERNAYEQGRITGCVEMRTEILSALKKIVGSEVWNNI